MPESKGDIPKVHLPIIVRKPSYEPMLPKSTADGKGTGLAIVSEYVSRVDKVLGDYRDRFHKAAKASRFKDRFFTSLRWMEPEVLPGQVNAIPLVPISHPASYEFTHICPKPVTPLDLETIISTVASQRTDFRDLETEAANDIWSLPFYGIDLMRNGIKRLIRGYNPRNFHLRGFEVAALNIPARDMVQLRRGFVEWFRANHFEKTHLQYTSRYPEAIWKVVCDEQYSPLTLVYDGIDHTQEFDINQGRWANFKVGVELQDGRVSVRRQLGGPGVFMGLAVGDYTVVGDRFEPDKPTSELVSTKYPDLIRGIFTNFPPISDYIE